MYAESAFPSPHGLQAEALTTFTGVQSAPKAGTENRAILVIATGPFGDFEAILEQHRHCCTGRKTVLSYTSVQCQLLNKGLKKICSKRLWNNLHIYILPVTYGLNFFFLLMA